MKDLDERLLLDFRHLQFQLLLQQFISYTVQLELLAYTTILFNFTPPLFLCFLNLSDCCVVRWVDVIACTSSLSASDVRNSKTRSAIFVCQRNTYSNLGFVYNYWVNYNHIIAGDIVKYTYVYMYICTGKCILIHSYVNTNAYANMYLQICIYIYNICLLNNQLRLS